jgi:hypothetical protein
MPWRETVIKSVANRKGATQKEGRIWKQLRWGSYVKTDKWKDLVVR